MGNYFLEAISQIDASDETLSDKELIEHLDQLEKVHSKIHDMLITARMKKIMQDFGERETDIHIVTFAKSGTTLMQMIVYQMTTDGSMDFEHLYDVSPWCRFSAYFNKEMPSIGERRIIKSHDPYGMLKGIKKGKFIFVIRDCLDVISSYHQHIKDYNNPDADFEELANRKMKEWFEYNRTWIENQSGLDMLFIHYEDIIENKKNVIEKIAEFLDVEVNQEQMSRIIERSSIKFMKEHEDKFGEQPEHWKVYNNFIRNGNVGNGEANFSDKQMKEYLELSEAYKVSETTLSRYFT